MNIKPITFFPAMIISIILLFAAPAGAQQDTGAPESSQTDTSSVDWDSISVLDLKTAERIALSGNPSIAAAEARLRQAEERVSQAGSAYWPRLDANAGASRVWLSENDYQTNLTTAQVFNPAATIDDPSDHYRADLTASWLMFNGFARNLTKKSAQYGMDQLEQSREDIKRQLVLGVATAYLSAQQALENITIARLDEQFFRDRHHEAQVRYQIGTGSLSDKLSFEVSFNAAISERIRAERLYEAALYSLAALLGLENATLPAHVTLAELNSESPREMGHPDPGQLITYAHEHRPDLLQSEIAVKNAEVDVKIAKSGFYPTISLVGSVSGNREEDYDFEGDDFGNSVGINLTYNLFAGGIDRAKTREARQKEIESKKTLEKTRLDVAADIRSSIADLRASQEQLLLLRANTELVRQNRDLAEQEYNAGQGSLVRLNEAQRNLTNAKSSLAFALVSMRQSWYALEAKTGRILEYFDN